MAKKKEKIIVVGRTEYTATLSEARRKELFPNSPPPTLKELLELKKKR
jgi:hypothetical protein